MKLTVENFGPIRKAKDIEVNPMTVFVGPSNTGKSYMAILIYSILKAFDGEEAEVGDLPWTVRYAFNITNDMHETHETYGDRKGILRKIDQLFQTWAEDISDLWQNQMVYYFGVEGHEILGHKILDGQNNLVVKVSDERDGLILDLCSPENSTLSSQKKMDLFESMNNKTTTKKNWADLLRKLEDTVEDDVDTQRMYYRVNLYFIEALHRLFFSALVPAQSEVKGNKVESHYLPATRGGVMQSHRAIVSRLIKRAPESGSNQVHHLSLLAGVSADFMGKLIHANDAPTDSHAMNRDAGMASHHLDRTRIAKIGEEMERKVMEGKINIKFPEAPIPDFRYAFERDEGEHDLPLMHASSMVAELAPVSLFIRYHVRRGDLLILEEPEAHLHPAAQIEITNLLVRLVNAGVYVLITTHSDNILEQIGNCVRISGTRNKRTRTKAQILKKTASVYLFPGGKTAKQKNTTVKNVPFDPEFGFLTQDHLDVSSALYNDTVNLLDDEEGHNDQK